MIAHLGFSRDTFWTSWHYLGHLGLSWASFRNPFLNPNTPTSSQNSPKVTQILHKYIQYIPKLAQTPKISPRGMAKEAAKTTKLWYPIHVKTWNVFNHKLVTMFGLPRISFEDLTNPFEGLWKAFNRKTEWDSSQGFRLFRESIKHLFNPFWSRHQDLSGSVDRVSEAS